MSRKSTITIKWSSELAYAIGLIATDGNLSPDRRHIGLTSKDKEIVESFRRCLGLTNKIGLKGNGTSKEKRYHVVQFGSVVFYTFLERIGLTAAKSKTLKELKIPPLYFFDFLRGCIDGDGSITSSKHPESTSPQLRLRLCSASKPFLTWIKREIRRRTGIQTGWIYTGHPSLNILSYGKTDSIKIFKKMYYSGVTEYLDRKYQIAKSFME